ncbi:Adenylyl-sulfate kinase1 [Zea mays]|jgi:hypothetical protein|uniref:Adenylyl-sulfate kinase1 n=1 Tax=Zea mays TaxID=4577 RepID=A0A1D6IHG3_MAIZE|nr:Adenylyl-sulfate kinase1 [Zea mays]
MEIALRKGEKKNKSKWRCGCRLISFSIYVTGSRSNSLRMTPMWEEACSRNERVEQCGEVTAFGGVPRRQGVHVARWCDSWC